MDEKEASSDKSNHKPKNNYTEKLKRASKPSSKFKGQSSNTKVQDGGGGGEKGKAEWGSGPSRHGRYGGQAQRQRPGQGQFPEYLPPPEVLTGLRNNTLIEGVLRINPKSYEDAFISSPDPKEQDIYIKVCNNR